MQNLYRAKAKWFCMLTSTLSIIYINKTVKKPQKYGKLLDELNTQDIRTSYNISGKDIVCRSMFSKPEDVAVQADKILTEMAQFR